MKAVGIPFTLIGCILLIISIIFTKSRFDFIDRSERVLGEVVGLQGYDTVAPVIEFTSLTGERFTFVGSVSSSPPAYAVGEDVDVIYERDTPQDALINSFFQLYFVSLITGFLGTIFTGIGIALWRVSNKDPSEELNHYKNIRNFNP